MNAIERTAAAQMSEGHPAFSDTEVDRIFDATIAYIEAGLSTVGGAEIPPPAASRTRPT